MTNDYLPQFAAVRTIRPYVGCIAGLAAEGGIGFAWPTLIDPGCWALWIGLPGTGFGPAGRSQFSLLATG